MNESSLETVRFLAQSDNRVAVLTSLTTRASFTRSELECETGIPRSTVSRILLDLQDREVVSRVGHRYEVTSFGRFLAERLHLTFESIEAMQRLQRLLNQLSDADPDVTFTDHPGCEILVPTSADPKAPVRRLADLLHAAAHVRLLVPDPISVLLNEDPTIRSGKQAFDIVVPRIVFEAERNDPMFSQQLRGVVASGDLTLFSYDGDIGHFVGIIDETAVVGPTDDAGTIQGYIETSDEIVRSWTEATVGEYTRDAVRVDTENPLS